MRISKKLGLSLLSIITAVTITAVSPLGGVLSKFASAVGDAVTLQEGDKTVAHGITLKADGTFDFTVNGVKYKNEYERILAEEGFIYGMDWNTIGDYSEMRIPFGDNEITGAKSAYRQGYIERGMYNLKQMGFNCINVWITSGGTGYTYDENGLVTGINDTFVRDLRMWCESSRKVGIDFLPTLLVHGYTEAYNEVYNGLTPQDRYFKYYRYYYDDTAREAYIKNGIEPICKILSEYQDILPMIDLTVENGTGVNDLESGMIFSSYYGPTWKGFATVFNALNAASKKYMPDIPTCVEDQSHRINAAKYNDLDVDIIGHNCYGVSGNVQDLSEFYKQRPAYLGEFNVGEALDVNHYSDAVLDAARIKYFRSAVENGYIGAFYFSFMAGAPGRRSNYFEANRTDDYTLMNSYAIPMAYEVYDLKNEHKGLDPEMDTPVILYNNDSPDLFWVGGRNVHHFIVERSDNGGDWKVIADNVDAYDNQIANGLMKYTDTTREKGVKFRYRITAVRDDGLTCTSEPSNENQVFVPTEMFVDANGNYAGSFEEGDYTGDSKAENSNGWYTSATHVAEFSTDTARTGEYSFHMDYENGIGTPGRYTAKAQYNLVVEPKTTYLLSYWYKNADSTISITARPQDSDGNLCYGSTGTTEDDEWHYNEVRFTAPDDGKIRIVIMNSSESDAKHKFYLDDISIVEAR